MRRSTQTFAAAAMGLATLGLSAAGLLGGLPEPARVLIAWIGVVIAPAAVVASIAAARVGALGFTLGFPVAMVTVLSLHAIAAEAAARTGLRLSVYTAATTWILLTGFLAAMLWALTTRRSLAAGFRAPAWLIVGAIALAGVAAVSRPLLAPSEDALDHIGYVRRAVVQDSLRPDGPLVQPQEAAASILPDPRKGTFHSLLAGLTELASCDPSSTWQWTPVIVFPVAAFAFAAFAAGFVGYGLPLAACLGLFALSYGGTGLQFAPTVAYGQNLAAAWYWVIAALALRASTTALTPLTALVLAAMVAGGVLVHLGVALHVFVLAATLLACGVVTSLPRQRCVRLALLVSTAGVAAVAWRLVGATGTPNPIHAHMQGMMEVGKGWWVASPMEVLREHGIVFLGGLLILGALIPAARRDARARLALAFSLLPLALAFVPWLATPLFSRASYMVLRVLLNAPVIPATVIVFAWTIQGARRGGIARRLLVCAALALWATTFLMPAVRAFSQDARRMRQPPVRRMCSEELLAWARRLPSGSTILSDPATSYVLSAFTSHRFVAIAEQHASPFDAYALDRLRAVRDVLSPYAVADVAPPACRRYRVDYVVVNRRSAPGPVAVLSPWSPDLLDPALARLVSMTASFQRVLDTADAVAFRFEPGGAVAHPAAGPVPPVVAGDAPLSLCAPPVPDDSFLLTGLSVSPSRLQAGDSALVTVGYRRDEPVEYGFPYVLHLRFDHSSVPETRRYPGEKFVRRARERWTGEFVRFRADLRPGHGVFDPDLWPMGVELRERFVVVVPSSARPGSYRVEVKVEREALVPNFQLDDLLFNRDHYSGTPCTNLVVEPSVTRAGNRS